jgi:uncharacterized lipoprotein YmbA
MIARAFLCALSAVLLGACASALPEHFYSLTSDAVTPTTAASDAAFSITIERITVPELVDRPQIVLSTGDHQVKLMEGYRWAESLRQAIPRQVADNLRRQFPRASIATVSDSTVNAQASYRLAMDIVRFDSRLDDGVDIAVHWRLRNAAGVVVEQVSNIHEKSIGVGYDALVAAHGKALVRLSNEIATAIPAAHIGR